MDIIQREMADPPSEDPRKLSDGLLVGGLKGTQLLCVLVGLFAKEVGAWRGVGVQALAASIGDLGTNFPSMHPSAWLSLNTNHHLACAARKAAAEGLVTLQDGYVFPTSKLAAQLLAASR